MQLSTYLVKSLISKPLLASMALCGFLLFAGAPGAKANDRDDYNRRSAVRYDDHRLHEAIEHHGYYSRDANYWRHERREALEHGWRDRYGCWHRY